MHVCPCGRSSVGLWPVGYGGGVGLCPCSCAPCGRSSVGRWSVPVGLWPSVSVCWPVGRWRSSVGGLCPVPVPLSYRGGREYSSPLLACSCGRFARWFAMPPNFAVFVPCDGQTGGGAVIRTTMPLLAVYGRTI